LEKELDEDFEKQRRWLKRQERKNRDSFLCLLDELHEQGKLHSMSLWVDLYSTIAGDERFLCLLEQTGNNHIFD
jgi:pre-mRNA-processing factor 40